MRKLIFLALFPASVLAGQVGPVTTFNSGDTLTASDLNGNFTAHEAAINDNDTRITGNSNTLNTHAGDASAHHSRYSDAEAVSAVKAADGAGSGLDADTLDGKQASDFAGANQSCAGGNVVTGVDVSGAVICGADADTVYTDADAVSAIDASYGAVGGGLEANTLDGMDSTDFVNRASPSWVTRTGYMSVSPPAFTQYANTSPSSFVRDSRMLASVSNGAWFVAPLNLPHGSTVTKVVFYFYDVDVGTDITFATTYADFTGNLTYMTPSEASEGTSGSVGNGSLEYTTITDPVVANDLYKYSMAIYIPNNTFRFYGARVEYTYSEPY